MSFQKLVLVVSIFSAGFSFAIDRAAISEVRVCVEFYQTPQQSRPSDVRIPVAPVVRGSSQLQGLRNKIDNLEQQQDLLACAIASQTTVLAAGLSLWAYCGCPTPWG